MTASIARCRRLRSPSRTQKPEKRPESPHRKSAENRSGPSCGPCWGSSLRPLCSAGSASSRQPSPRREPSAFPASRRSPRPRPALRNWSEKRKPEAFMWITSTVSSATTAACSRAFIFTTSNIRTRTARNIRSKSTHRPARQWSGTSIDAAAPLRASIEYQKRQRPSNAVFFSSWKIMLRSSGQKAFPWGKVAEWSEVGWGKEETTSSPLRGLSPQGEALTRYVPPKPSP